MDVLLKPELARFVDEKLRAGQYQGLSDMVNAALQMLKELSEREVRRAGRDGDREALTELALRILYQRKAFREVTGMDDEHYPEGHPPPPPHGPGGQGPERHGPGPKGRGAKHKPPPTSW